MSAPEGYKPREGSAGHRAIEQLEINGPMAHTDLADAIDVSSGNLRSNIVLALEAGLIHRAVGEDGVATYSLGDGVPVEIERERAPRSAPGAPKAAKVRRARATKAAAKPAPKPAPKPRAVKVVTQAAPAPAPLAIPTPADFACGIFSDGRIVVEKAGQQITLAWSETKQLLAFLERMSTEPEVAA